MYIPHDGLDTIGKLLVSAVSLQQENSDPKSDARALRSHCEQFLENLRLMPFEWFGYSPLKYRVSVFQLQDVHHVIFESIDYPGHVDPNGEMFEGPAELVEIIGVQLEISNSVKPTIKLTADLMLQYIEQIVSNLNRLKGTLQVHALSREGDENILSDRIHEIRIDALDWPEKGRRHLARHLSDPKPVVGPDDGSSEVQSSTFLPSKDYRSIRLGEMSFSLTPSEAQVVKFIHDQHKAGQKVVSKVMIFSSLNKESDKNIQIRDIFSKQNRDMILKHLILREPGKQGLYYLRGRPNFGEGFEENDDSD